MARRIETVGEDEVRDLVRRVVREMTDEVSPNESPPTDEASPSASAPSPAPGQGRVALGADHGGYALKEKLVGWVRELGYETEDCGAWSDESVDYPDLAHAVARQVASRRCDWGIVIDGAGIGSSMTANKVPGVRASLCWDVSSARNAREHNHANVLTLGAGLIGEGLARQIVRTWLETPWGPGRHARRVSKIHEVEAAYLKNQG